MRIIIVGGGTAGWLAALMISKAQPHHNITLIESSDIGIIGAGEGSTGLLSDIVQGNLGDFGCDEQDFFMKTNATLKLGIEHKEWNGLGTSYVAPLDSPLNYDFGTDYMLLHTVANGLAPHISSQNGYLIEKNKSTFFFKEDSYLYSLGKHAYHFDAHLVGQYFKSLCIDNINLIDTKISGVVLDNSGNVSYLSDISGNKIYGDFFIDASGFSRIISKSLGVSWNSYSNHLPVNSAMPFILDVPKHVKPVTTAWAQKNGWMWMIPTQERMGCGYVYDSNFISPDEAKLEIERVLGTEINPIKNIKFDAGTLDEYWTKNCLSIGLSSAFLEPLEATSIHTTIVQLYSFIFQYLKSSKEDTCNQGSIKIYNKRMSKMYEDMKNFINLHYATKRRDSDFWKYASSDEIRSDFSKLIMEISKVKIITNAELTNYWGYVGPSLYNWILTGLGYFDSNFAQKQIDFFGQSSIAKERFNSYILEMNTKNNLMIDNTKFIKIIREEKEKYI